MNEDTDREALARHYDPEAFEDHPIERRSPLAAIQWGARRKLAQEAADRVLVSGWLAARDKRMKAEQRETEGLYRLQAAARLLSDLDRNEHGRHQGDIDSFDPTGISQGNSHLVTGQTIGYDIGGVPYVVPEPRQRGTVEAWRES